MTAPPHVVVLLHFDLHHEPRARRQVASLRAAGHRVTVVAAKGSAGAMDSGVGVIEVEPQRLDLAGRWAIALRQGLIGRLSPRTAYWCDPANWRYRRALAELDPDLVIAHDWSTLPIAFAVRKAKGFPVLYDAHEYAVEQGAGRWRWRWLFPHMVRAIEGNAITQVDEVTTVSQGIADQLQFDYGLSRRPAVIRNTPALQRFEQKRTGATMTVLYHGLLNASRGLEALVDSVGLWEPGRRLVVRGPGTPAYVRRLEKRARSVDPARITIEPPVPPDQIIPASRTADIGVFVGDPSQGQLRFALPNKLFEYAMAGLAVVTTPLPEVERLNEAYDFALTTEGARPADIAAALNSLDPETVDHRKAQSLVAAEALCWEREQERWLQVVEPFLQ